MPKEVKKQKTISEQIQDIVEEMCSKYCVWPLKWDKAESEG